MEEPHAARRADRLARALGLNSDSPTTRQLLTHLDMRVDTFIGAFRRAGIRQEFPAEFLEMTVEEALRQGDSTVRKLLLDRRFAK
jgi:hypothetical protein